MSGLFALRIARGGQKDEVEELRALAIDGQTANYTVGNTILGGTSGASGVLVEQVDAGATAVLQLRDVKGNFVDNEALTDAPGAGDGLANGVLTTPLLTPSDALIMQIDGVDMIKAEALEALSKIRAHIIEMDWPDAAI